MTGRPDESDGGRNVGVSEPCAAPFLPARPAPSRVGPPRRATVVRFRSCEPQREGL